MPIRHILHIFLGGYETVLHLPQIPLQVFYGLANQFLSLRLDSLRLTLLVDLDESETECLDLLNHYFVESFVFIQLAFRRIPGLSNWSGRHFMLLLQHINVSPLLEFHQHAVNG